MSLYNPYCTVAQVQDEIRNRDGKIIPIIEDAITAASRYIEKHKGRDYIEHDYSTTPLSIDISDNYVIGADLWLPYQPIISLTLVQACGVTMVANTDYINKGYKLISIGGSWDIGYPPDDVIKLTGKFGYAQPRTTETSTTIDTTKPSPDIPGDINKACILIAASLSGYNTQEVIGIEGNKTALTDKTIPKTAMTLLGTPWFAIT